MNGDHPKDTRSLSACLKEASFRKAWYRLRRIKRLRLTAILRSNSMPRMMPKTKVLEGIFLSAFATGSGFGTGCDCCSAPELPISKGLPVPVILGLPDTVVLSGRILEPLAWRTESSISNGLLPEGAVTCCTVSAGGGGGGGSITFFLRTGATCKVSPVVTGAVDAAGFDCSSGWAGVGEGGVPSCAVTMTADKRKKLNNR